MIMLIVIMPKMSQQNFLSQANKKGFEEDYQGLVITAFIIVCCVHWSITVIITECTVCSKSFRINDGGKSQVEIHGQGMFHKQHVKAKKGQQTFVKSAKKIH